MNDRNSLTIQNTSIRSITFITCTCITATFRSNTLLRYPPISLIFFSLLYRYTIKIRIGTPKAVAQNIYICSSSILKCQLTISTAFVPIVPVYPNIGSIEKAAPRGKQSGEEVEIERNACWIRRQNKHQEQRIPAYSPHVLTHVLPIEYSIPQCQKEIPTKWQHRES